MSRRLSPLAEIKHTFMPKRALQNRQQYPYNQGRTELPPRRCSLCVPSLIARKMRGPHVRADTTIAVSGISAQSTGVHGRSDLAGVRGLPGGPKEGGIGVLGENNLFYISLL